jgi:hypothetical protein
LSLCYAALHSDRVRNLITCVTSVDFHADQREEKLDWGFMNVWTQNLSAEDIALLIPAPASKAVSDRLGTKDYTAASVPGGHIEIFCSRNQQKLRTMIADWLKAR